MMAASTFMKGLIFMLACLLAVGVAVAQVHVFVGHDGRGGEFDFSIDHDNGNCQHDQDRRDGVDVCVHVPGKDDHNHPQQPKHHEEHHHQVQAQHSHNSSRSHQPKHQDEHHHHVHAERNNSHNQQPNQQRGVHGHPEHDQPQHRKPSHQVSHNDPNHQQPAGAGHDQQPQQKRGHHQAHSPRGPQQPRRQGRPFIQPPPEQNKGGDGVDVEVHIHGPPKATPPPPPEEPHHSQSQQDELDPKNLQRSSQYANSAAPPFKSFSVIAGAAATACYALLL